MNQTLICNPQDKYYLREIVNNDLLLRHTITITPDNYIPRGIVYCLSQDKMIEIDEYIKETLKLEKYS